MPNLSPTWFCSSMGIHIPPCCAKNTLRANVLYRISSIKDYRILICKDLPLNKVVVEPDAATVVDGINGKAIMAAIDTIIQDCSILNLFEDIIVTAISWL